MKNKRNCVLQLKKKKGLLCFLNTSKTTVSKRILHSSCQCSRGNLEFIWTFSCSRIPVVKKPSTCKDNLSEKGKIKLFSTLGLKFQSYWDINSRSVLLYEKNLAHQHGRSNTNCKREGKAGKGFSPSSPTCLCSNSPGQKDRFTVSFILAACAVYKSLSTQQLKSRKQTTKQQKKQPIILLPILKL